MAMEVLYERCAGLDGHKKTVVACLRRSAPGGVTVQQTRTFSTMVLALEALRDWLLGEGCTAVGMEATGVYGKPVYNVLEGHGFELVVANGEHIKAVPGRKTDPTLAEVVGLRYTYRPVFVTIAGSHA